jgi:hypothetical protein
MIKHIVIRSIFALLIIALLIGGGFALYHAGMNQGYLAAAQTGAKSVAPVTPHGYFMPRGYPGRPYRAFPLLMPCLGILALFFVFWLITLPFRIARRAMFFHGWRHAGGPDYEAWAKEHEHFHGHMHEHWGRRWQNPPENKEKPENAGSSGESENKS